MGMPRAVGSAIWLPLLFGGGLPVAAARAAQADYSAQATAWRALHGLEALPADASALPAAIEKVDARLDVGVFELRYPWGLLQDTRRIEELRDLVLGLIDLQGTWCGWLAESGGNATPPAAVTLRNWVKGWRGEALKKALAARKPDESLLDVLKAGAAQRGAVEQLAAGMRGGAALGLELAGGATQLVLAPDRDAFVGFVAFIGTLQPDWKPLAWSQNLAQRSAFYMNDLLVLALVHPAPDGNPAGIPMDQREATGLQQHVLQYAADRLVKHTFGAALDPGLHQGLAVDLVIEVVGENNARLYGSGEGKTTPARERFVVGGRDGGKLAALNADSKWRIEKGRDWFVKQLKKAQESGGDLATSVGEAAPSPLAHFEIDAKDRTGLHDFASAPLLGAHAAEKGVPENFFADYQEFLRAYRACFVHWLLTAAKPAGGGKAGAAKLLRARLAQPEAPLDELAQEVFGVPLTDADPGSKALEWQFLGWLARART